MTEERPTRGCAPVDAPHMSGWGKFGASMHPLKRLQAVAFDVVFFVLCAILKVGYPRRGHQTALALP